MCTPCFQVTRYTAASQETIDTVRRFIRQHLKAAGLPELWDARTSMAVNRDVLHVNLPVAVANDMFRVQLHRFVPVDRTNGESGTGVWRSHPLVPGRAL